MNQVTAIYKPCGGCKTAPLYQFDYGQELVFEGFDLPSAFEVHFANEFEGEATTQIASDNVVTIPDAYLTSGANIYAWIFLHTGENDGETVFHIEIPVMERAAPTDETPSPVQQSVIDETIAALQSAVSEAQGYAEAASSAAASILNVGIVASDDGAGHVTLTIGG